MIFYTQQNSIKGDTHFIVITNYYPKLNYIKYDNIKGKISKISDNGIHLKFHDSIPHSIPVGAKIVFDIVVDSKKYTINKIIKYTNDYKMDVPHLYHYGLNKKIKYEIYFDEEINDINNSYMWTIKSYEHDINI
jgi:hypothetical protein